MMFVCCGSALLSKDTAERTDLMKVSWKTTLPGGRNITYAAPRALTLCVTCGVFFGLALAGLGLGLQAQNRVAAPIAVLITILGCAFWLLQSIFMAERLRSWPLTLGAGALCLLFMVLAVLAVGAQGQMWRNPPPRGHEILPADYKVPYSHMHEDPPEVRLAQEIEQRRERLAVQQKELEMLEEKIKRKMQQKDE